MEPVENRQRHGDVRDYGPRPVSIELQMRWSELGPVFLQHVDHPQRHVGHNQKRYWLPSGLPLRLFRVTTPLPGSMQDEDGLQACLHEREDFHQQTDRGVARWYEVGADYREHAINEHAGLGHDQEGIVHADTGVAFVYVRKWLITESWCKRRVYMRSNSVMTALQIL